jgi:hypothetical protein
MGYQVGIDDSDPVPSGVGRAGLFHAVDDSNGNVYCGHAVLQSFHNWSWCWNLGQAEGLRCQACVAGNLC